MDGTPLLWAGVLGPLLFVVVFLVDGATRPGYRPTYHPVSALALGRRGWIQTANFIVCGALIVVAAVGVLQATESIWMALALAVFGLALVASGVFAMDPMRGYPPGTPADAAPAGTTADRWHDRAGVVVFLGMPVLAAVAAFTLEEQAWVVWSAMVSALTLIGAIAFIVTFDRDTPRSGLIQRADIVLGWVWLASVCAHLA